MLDTDPVNDERHIGEGLLSHLHWLVTHPTHTALANGGAGVLAVSNKDVIDPDGAWTAPVAGVSPHLVMRDLGGAVGRVAVVGIDSTTINWTVVTEQLG